MNKWKIPCSICLTKKLTPRLEIWCVPQLCVCSMHRAHHACLIGCPSVMPWFFHIQFAQSIHGIALQFLFFQRNGITCSDNSNYEDMVSVSLTAAKTLIRRLGPEVLSIGLQGMKSMVQRHQFQKQLFPSLMASCLEIFST